MSNKMSRPKPPPPGNEEASATLNLGEFNNVDTLTLSEASLVLNALVAKRRNDRKNVNETEYALSFSRSVFPFSFAKKGREMAEAMLNQTLSYLDHFARFTQKENVEAVERLLSTHKDLAKFERAQLGSLCCETADEAKTLIPSLADKISDEDLKELLEEISKLQNR
ncbi:DNA-directed RNA polymerase II subunit rpb4 [Beauveria bassiana]|nr:DNA-directed RNA polymerase II subunit rpb4 [Beauveria bassiana]